jgi:hypothetical protein
MTQTVTRAHNPGASGPEGEDGRGRSGGLDAVLSRPVLRWLVPGGLVLVMATTGTIIAGRHPAAAELPRRSVAQLLVDLAQPGAGGVSGTVVERADLGLPALPGIIDGDGSADFTALLAGAHTLRVWSAGPTQSRVALLGTLGESDVVHDGQDLWVWSSTQNTAHHVRLPTATGPRPGSPPRLPAGVASLLATTPLAAAARVLAAIDPTTSVTSGGTVTVAGRSAYELVVAPRDPNSLVGSVRIDLDGQYHAPLRVRIFARGYAAAALDIGFTDVSYKRPDAALFRFVPAPDVKVVEGLGADGAGGVGGLGAPTAATVIGTGWTTILGLRLPSATATGTSPAPRSSGPNALDALIRQLPRVSGAWGSGRMIQARLVSLLVTDDGRLFVGPVAAAALLAAAGSPAGALTPGSGITHR